LLSILRTFPIHCHLLFFTMVLILLYEMKNVSVLKVLLFSPYCLLDRIRWNTNWLLWCLIKFVFYENGCPKNILVCWLFYCQFSFIIKSKSENISLKGAVTGCYVLSIWFFLLTHIRQKLFCVNIKVKSKIKIDWFPSGSLMRIPSWEQ
jgi:hypothetical protein